MMTRKRISKVQRTVRVAVAGIGSGVSVCIRGQSLRLGQLIKCSACSVCFLFLAALATPSNAEVIATEFFNGYGASEIVCSSASVLNGGTGWDSAWEIGDEKYVPAASLSYSATGYNNSANLGGSGDGAMAYAGNLAGPRSVVIREFTTSSTTVWLSALVSIDETWDRAILWIDSTAGSQGNDFVGVIDNAVYMRYNNLNSTAAGVPTIGTHLLLAKAEINVSGNNDRLSFWFDPNLSGGEAGLGPATYSQENADTFGPSIDGIGVMLVNRDEDGGGGYVTDSDTEVEGGELMDAIRVGTSFADVTASPFAKGTLILIGGGHSSSGSAAPRYYQPWQAVEPVTNEYDVAVYGGTPAGVTAAIQAARMGKSTILLSFNRHVGGMTSGGLTATDVGDQSSIGGIAHEFYTRIGSIKDFSPSTAETLYRTMLQEAGVTVRFRRCLASVTMQDNHVVSLTMETGETVAADMFIDATYEGDLLASAHVSYHVGREPEGAYGESFAGQWKVGDANMVDVYQFCRLPISPYLVDGDPASGLLPEIMTDPAGASGEGDYRVQAYNFRMHLSNAAGRIPFPRPPGYGPARYALLARFLNQPGITWTLNYTRVPMTDGPVQMRNGDSNNAGSFSSDYVGGSNRWPDGTYQPISFATLPAPRRGLPVALHDLYLMRERIFQEHVRYQQGYMYFLANDPQVPADLQARVKAWGLRPDEFADTAHWPHQLYIREGRRMVADYVMTQANCESTVTVADSVGLGSYAMDSHFCQRVVVQEDGTTTVRNEGNISKACPGPYPISCRSIVPTQSECNNLLVPVCLSASHVAYGSIRMEPVFMILGQSAGAVAGLAIDSGTAVQEVPYDQLRQRLVTDGQILLPL